MLGSKHIALNVIDSTNSHVRSLLKRGAREGIVVTADHQTAGRGRLDRQWTDEAGLCFLGSYLLEPVRPTEEWGGLPLLTGIAVVRTLNSLVPVDLHLKWPNDVLAGERKICGILVESGQMGNSPWAIVGIGINLNQREFHGEYRLPPTSLLLETGRLLPPGEVLARLSAELTTVYRQWTLHGNQRIIAEWKEHAAMLGEEIVMELEDGNTERVTAVDIAESGALVIRDQEGVTREIFAGDISIINNDTGAKAS